MLDERIGFIGAGQMATVLAHGFVKAGLTTSDHLLASDVDERARQRFTQTTSGRAIHDNAQVVGQSDVIIFAVKPQQMAKVASEIRGKIAADRLVVSICAGVRLASLAEWLGEELRIIRVMPNPPCLVGQGATAFSLGARATAEDGALVEQLFGALGSAWKVEEKLLDAVTAMASSGTGFLYVVIEAMSDAGVRLGLPRDVATAMAAKTMLGSAQMVLATGEHPAVLKDRVASPGGTTIAGLHALESGGLRAALIDAVLAAAQRSVELGARD
jgi:pyrroline-5-carboxylate reductase